MTDQSDQPAYVTLPPESYANLPPEAHGERLVLMREGDETPPGWEIARILAEAYDMCCPGTTSAKIYTVALRRTTVGAP